MDWHHVLNVFLGRLLGYIFLMLPFFPRFQMALFELLLVRPKKSSDEVLAFVNQASIGITKSDLYSFFSVYPDKTEEDKKARLDRLSYGYAVFELLFSNAFLCFTLYMFSRALYDFFMDTDATSAVISLAWLALPVYRYFKILFFGYRLRPAYQRYLTTLQ
ncbi:MAG: hypothetical protein HY862_07025 [Chloroflexi bacterium]|nr:hypothetical protein [Chloroflexota bacterium]